MASTTQATNPVLPNRLTQTQVDDSTKPQPIGKEVIRVGGKTIEIPRYSASQFSTSEAQKAASDLATAKSSGGGGVAQVQSVSPSAKVTAPTATGMATGTDTSYLTGVSKFAPSQGFSFSSVTGQFEPVGAGGTPYAQLPTYAKAELETRGIISGSEAPPSGASYTYQPGLQTKTGQNVFAVSGGFGGGTAIREVQKSLGVNVPILPAGVSIQKTEVSQPTAGGIPPSVTVAPQMVRYTATPQLPSLTGGASPITGSAVGGGGVPSALANVLSPGAIPRLVVGGISGALSPKKDVLTFSTNPDEQGFVNVGKDTYLSGTTSTGEQKFVKVPFTKEQFVSQSLKSQSFDDFKKATLATAEQNYATDSARIIASGQVPESKDEYLAKVTKDLTPDYQKELISEQYIPSALKFAKETQAKDKGITAYTLPEVQKFDVVAKRTEAFKSSGEVPVGLKALSETYVDVSLPRIAGEVATSLGQKELGQSLITGAGEAQARKLAEASVAGESVGGKIGFEVGSIPETYTGIVGTSYLGGLGAGAGLKAVGIAGAGSKVAEVLTLHPTLTKVGLQYGLPAGIEAFNIYERAQAGATPAEQVSSTGKEVLFLGAFGAGTAKGLNEGFPIKYKDVGFETTGGQRVPLAKVLSYEEGGKANILLSKQPGEGIKFGSPRFAEAPQGALTTPITPFSATEAEVLKAAKGAPGGSPAEVQKIEAIQNIFGSIDKGVAPVKPSEFKADSRIFAQQVARGEITQAQADEYNRAITNIVKKYKSNYIELYGSSAQRQQMIPGTGRQEGDYDIMLRAREDKAIAIANKFVADARKAGIDVYISEEKPTLITVGSAKPGAPHLFDLHYIGEPTPDVIQDVAYGKSLTADTFQLDNIPTSKLYKEGFRKAASVGTIQPGETFAGATVSPELPKRAKDIADVTRISENIQAGYLQTGQVGKAAKIGSAVSLYKQAFGEAAIPKGTASPLVSFVGEQGLSGTSAISKVASATVSIRPSVASSAPTLRSIPSASVTSRSPSLASVRASLGSPSVSGSSALSRASASLSAPSRSASPSSRSPSSSPSISASPSSRPPSISPSVSGSPSIYSPSVSASPSLSPSASSRPSAYSPSTASPSSGLFTPRPGGGAPGKESSIGKSLRFKVGKLPGQTRREKSYGFISEGISKQLYGKATLGKTKFTEISAPTAELEKAGITSPGEFLTRGGFVSSKKVKLGGR